MSIIRTPETRSADLPGYPFASHCCDARGARVHHVDEGAGQVILSLHGEPTWWYLYRTIVPALIQITQLVAPDIIGLGKSGKFTKQSDYYFRDAGHFLQEDKGEEITRHIVRFLKRTGG